MIELAGQQWDALTSCPDWCTTDHKDAHPGGWRTYHDGPTFGGVSVTWAVMDPNCPADMEWSVYVDELHYNPEFSSITAYSPEKARALSADLLAATAWAEGSAMSAATLVEVEGVGPLTVDQAHDLCVSVFRAILQAESPAAAFREQMFGDPRPVEEWETVRLFTTAHGRRAHVVDTASISHRYDGVRVGDPFVTSACSMVWAFADDVSLDVDGVPMCECCARTLLEAQR